MATDTRPIYGTLVFLGILAAALLVLQPYSADWPRSIYSEPARRYIQAAMRQDSATLARLSASESPVRWALAAALEPDTARRQRQKARHDAQEG